MNTINIGKVGPRHIQVANSVLEGRTNKEIAVLMDITERTVKQYVADLFKATSVTTRSQFIVKCFNSVYGKVQAVCG